MSLPAKKKLTEEQCASDYLGVTWSQDEHAWQASITVQDIPRVLGSFHSERAAAARYDETASRLGRPLNFQKPSASAEGGMKVSTEFRGVSWDGLQWAAYVPIDGVHIHLGCFASEVAAACKHDEHAPRFGLPQNFTPNLPLAKKNTEVEAQRKRKKLDSPKGAAPMPPESSLLQRAEPGDASARATNHRSGAAPATRPVQATKPAAHMKVLPDTDTGPRDRAEVRPDIAGEGLPDEVGVGEEARPQRAAKLLAHVKMVPDIDGGCSRHMGVSESGSGLRAAAANSSAKRTHERKEVDDELRHGPGDGSAEGEDADDKCCLCGKLWTAGEDGWPLCDQLGCKNIVCSTCVSHSGLPLADLFFCPLCTGSHASAKAVATSCVDASAAAACSTEPDVADRKEDAVNRGAQRSSHRNSRFTGVSWHSKKIGGERKKHGGNKQHLGFFAEDKEEDAARKCDQAKQ